MERVADPTDNKAPGGVTEEPQYTPQGSSTSSNDPVPQRKWHHSVVKAFKEPGGAPQIVTAAILGIVIGVSVSVTVGPDIPEAVPVILEIPGSLWLRALRATVLPLIVVAIIIAVQNLKAMAKGGAKLARWTIGYYIGTTIIAIVISTIMTALVWRPLMTVASGESLTVTDGDQETIDENAGTAPHDIVVTVAESFIPQNVFAAVANDELLAVLVSAVVVGCLIEGPDSSLMRGIREVEKIIMWLITFLIKLAPIGVFFLIMSNLFTLDVEDIGQNLGVFIGGTICQIAIHLFIVLPAIFFIFTRTNPYTYWIKSSRSWILAWASASSAATMPVTLQVAAKHGIPNNVSQFVIPLGTLINMDGTAIYFPMVVVFLAQTQGMTLNAGDYVIIVLLATLSSIATTPIPSSSLVLTLIIAQSVGVPITGMYAVVVAIDWFLDRFRTMSNVSGDLFAARAMWSVTGITDEVDVVHVHGTDIPHAVGHGGAEMEAKVGSDRV